MTVSQIISSGLPGTESAALDVAIRFNIPYSGYTNQGSLLPGDRPRGRYSLIEKPFVHPMIVMQANLEMAESLLIFSNGSPPARIQQLLSIVNEKNYPCLGIDFAVQQPHQATFEIAEWMAENRLSRLFVTGSSLQEDVSIYQSVNDTLTQLFMLTNIPASPSVPHGLH